MLRTVSVAVGTVPWKFLPCHRQTVWRAAVSPRSVHRPASVVDMAGCRVNYRPVRGGVEVIDSIPHQPPPVCKLHVGSPAGFMFRVMVSRNTILVPGMIEYPVLYLRATWSRHETWGLLGAADDEAIRKVPS